jgi:hypothetical protein
MNNTGMYSSGASSAGISADIPADEVIRIRQAEIVADIDEIDIRLEEIARQIDALDRERGLLEEKRRRRLLEHDLWNRYDRGIIVTQTTVEIHGGNIGRKRTADRLPIEECLRRIFEAAGRPLAFSEIRERLEAFGYRWNRYISAHNYLTRKGLLEPTGKRGFYNLSRRW